MIFETDGFSPRSGYDRSWAAAGEADIFDLFVDRTEPVRLRFILGPWTAPEKYFDWGADEQFMLETGAGECAA